MSFETRPTEVILSKHEIADGLRARYDTIHLAPNTVYEIPPNTNTENEIAIYGALHEGENQRLRALIKTPRDEFYAIVDITIINKIDGKVSGISQTTALTCHVPNQNAELVGCFDDQAQITVGRIHAGISERYFSVIRDDTGIVRIQNHEATNETEVFTFSNNIQSEVSKRLLHMDTVNPAEDTDFWSLKFRESGN